MDEPAFVSAGRLAGEIRDRKAGLASLSHLPATAAPLGLTRAGLPVGIQVIGAEGEDLTTVEFARLLAAEIGGFIPPPGYA